MKRCCRCREYKPLTEFYKNNQSKDSLDWLCKRCKTLENKQYQAKIKSFDVEKTTARDEKQEKEFANACGGIIIKIVNHSKKGEYKYQVGDLMTNDKKAFINKVNKILGEL